MTDDVLLSSDAAVGRITLNRPKPFHALTREMCEAMSATLSAWRADPAIRLVLIEHQDGRGFCAGGDVRAVWESGKRDGDYARAFFRVEYQLNHQLFTYSKPVVAFMDGATMGGGIGLSLPARYRVATERTVLAMSETGIGLFPGAGGGWYLSRLPGRTGAFLALTGARLDGAECMTLGLCTHYLPSDALPQVKARLIAAPDQAERILADAAMTPPPARIARNRERIDRLFASDRFEEILAALEADGSEWARKELATLRGKSPQSVKVALRLIAQGRDHVDFAEEMRVEYGLAVHSCQRHDFLEGVRAVLVDRDNAPAWQPATPEGVTDHLIDQIFAPLPDAEGWQPLR